MAHAKGTRLVHRGPSIEGKAVERRFNEDASELEYLLRYDGEDGQPHERWFLESQVELAERQDSPESPADEAKIPAPVFKAQA